MTVEQRLERIESLLVQLVGQVVVEPVHPAEIPRRDSVARAEAVRRRAYLDGLAAKRKAKKNG